LPDDLQHFRFRRKTGILEKRQMKKLYVGNLPFTATESDVRALFEKHGDVNSVALINDRETGRPRGFGFVEMDDNGFAKAIEALNGYQMDGRALMVNEAQDKPRREGGDRGGRSGGGRSGGGGRDRW
jgi:RNA recognition motif-containing protein